MRLRHHSTVHHAEPVVAPEIRVDRNPIAVIANLLRIEHERAISTSACGISLQPNVFNCLAVAIHELFTKPPDVSIVFSSEYDTERGKTCSHGNRICVWRATVEHLALRNKLHHRSAPAECGKRQASTNRFGEADHIWGHAEMLGSTARAKLGPGFDFVENQQRVILTAKRPQTAKESRLRHAEAEVHHNRFDNDRCNFARILPKAQRDAV